MLSKTLKEGDTIGIIAPSKFLDPEKKSEVDNFIAYMKEQGIEVELSKNFYETGKYGTADPQKRADDINSMFADGNIKAIWCLQGGNNGNQISRTHFCQSV